jgi:L-Ala-D/L-Glu epimerase
MMHLRGLQLSTPVIPFTSGFRHASAERCETSTVWITAETSAGIVGQGESCPRPYVTGETLESAATFFERWRPAVAAAITDVDTLRTFVGTHAEAIDHAPAAWCAIELALLDALGRTDGQPVEALLGLPALRGPFTYTAVLGDADAATFERQLARYLSLGFRDMKLKVSGDAGRDYPKLERLGATSGVSVRVDANNLWAHPEAAIEYLRRLPGPVVAVEEPLGPRRFADMARLVDATGVPVILDESVSRVRDLDTLASAPDRWLVNVRVSKMGGVLRALDVVARARLLGVPVIVGAQVGETSLLTRAALPVAEAAGNSLRGQEGAFGTHLLERDVCDPPLMFGAGGRLEVADHPRLARPGLGVT